MVFLMKGPTVEVGMSGKFIECKVSELVKVFKNILITF